MEKNWEISDASLINKGLNVLIPRVGKHFWVDGSTGVDTNNGLSPANPVLTVTQALTLCTAGAYDVIHILANSPSSAPAAEIFPIAVNKNGVTIRGEHGSGLLSDSGIGSYTKNKACFEIGAHYVTIEDLYMGVDNEGSDGGIIEFNGTNCYFGTTIRRCTFDTQYIAAYGILATYDQPYLLVEDCVFGGTWIAGYTTAGIYIGNLTGGMIRRNVFNKNQGIAISAGVGASNFQILNNQFNLPSDTVGKAVTLADGSLNIFTNGNHANFGMTAMTNNPYRDLNNDTSNTWGLNYKAGLSVMPIGT